MSKPHYMQLPREVILGEGVIGGTGEACRRLGFAGKALIVSGPKTREIAGEKVAESLLRASFEVEKLIVEESTVESVKSVEDKICVWKPTVVAAVGGGKDIDVAKLGSTNQRVPFLSIPTAASHDGIASPHASIGGFDVPHSVRAQAPIGIIVDIDIILNSPSRLTASGCGDIISKYTAVRDWRLAHEVKKEYYGNYAAELALMSAKLVMKNVEGVRDSSRDGIRTVVEALVSCGVAMSIAGSTRPCSGSEHLFSHALDIVAEKPALHGEQCGVGTIMCAFLHRSDWKRIRDVLRRINAPTTAEDLGVNRTDIVKALTVAHELRPERYTVLGERGLSWAAAERLAQRTGVVE